MKKTLITVVILGGAAAATPFVIGMQAEKRFAEDHERIQQELVYPNLSVEAGEFNRGWLASNATTRFIFTPEEEGAEQVTFEMNHQINQVPSLGDAALLSVDSEMTLPPELAPEFDKLLAGKPLLSATTLVKFNGEEHATFSSPEFSGQLEEENNVQVVWKGLQGSSVNDRQNEKLSLSMNAPSLSIKGDDGQFELGSMRYEATMHRGSHGMWYGYGEASLATMAVDAVSEVNGPTHVTLDNVLLTSQQNENDELVDITGKLTLDSANINGYQVANGIYDVGYLNLDAAKLAEFNESTKRLMREQPNNPQMLVQQMMTQMQGILGKNAKLDIKRLAMETPQGPIDASLSLALRDKLEPQMMQNPPMLLDIVDLNLDASLPKVMVEGLMLSQAHNMATQMALAQGQEPDPEHIAQQAQQITQQQLQGLVAQNLMVDAGELYTTKVSYTPHKLLINEQDATPMIQGMLQ